MAPFSSPGSTRLHPLHALLLGVPVTLFAAALLADIAYLNTAEMQWSNFAAWAITGALMIGAAVLAWGVIAAVRGRAPWLYPLLLAVGWLTGLVNAFQHSRDAWASVGAAGLIMSLIATGATLAAGWLAFSPRRTGAVA